MGDREIRALMGAGLITVDEAREAMFAIGSAGLQFREAVEALRDACLTSAEKIGELVAAIDPSRAPRHWPDGRPETGLV